LFVFSENPNNNMETEPTIDTERKVECDVADGAPGCFASLVDHFTRRGIDTGSLAEHGLVSTLLQRLSNAAGQAACCIITQVTPQASYATATSNPTSDAYNANTAGSTSSSVSTVISLPSTLCRLVDLLLVLLFEECKALPRNGGNLVSATGTGTRSSGATIRSVVVSVEVDWIAIGHQVVGHLVARLATIFGKKIN